MGGANRRPSCDLGEIWPVFHREGASTHKKLLVWPEVFEYLQRMKTELEMKIELASPEDELPCSNELRQLAQLPKRLPSVAITAKGTVIPFIARPKQDPDLSSGPVIAACYVDEICEFAGAVRRKLARLQESNRLREERRKAFQEWKQKQEEERQKEREDRQQKRLVEREEKRKKRNLQLEDSTEQRQKKSRIEASSSPSDVIPTLEDDVVVSE